MYTYINNAMSELNEWVNFKREYLQSFMGSCRHLSPDLTKLTFSAVKADTRKER